MHCITEVITFLVIFSNFVYSVFSALEREKIRQQLEEE